MMLDSMTHPCESDSSLFFILAHYKIVARVASTGADFSTRAGEFVHASLVLYICLGSDFKSGM